MSWIDILALSVAYTRHDDRELFDAEPIGAPPRYFSRIRPIARPTRVMQAGPSERWWPASQIFASDVGEDLTMPPVTSNNQIDFTGNSGYPYRIRGFALDSNGAGVSNAEIQLYRASDKAYLRSISTVDPSGQYDHGTDDTTTQHFIRSVRLSPDIVGTTVSTLTGS